MQNHLLEYSKQFFFYAIRSVVCQDIALMHVSALFFSVLYCLLLKPYTKLIILINHFLAEVKQKSNNFFNVLKLDAYFSGGKKRLSFIRFAL
jgi:hypothetical protein